MSRTKDRVRASAIYHGTSPARAEEIAGIVAPAEANAESAAMGLAAGDYVVCDVWHSHRAIRVGYVESNRLMSFGGGILSDAIIKILSQPYRFSRSADFHEHKRYGGTDNDVCTLADGSVFVAENPAGIVVWRDGNGVEVSITDEAVRRTPAK